MARPLLLSAALAVVALALLPAMTHAVGCMDPTAVNYDASQKKGCCAELALGNTAPVQTLSDCCVAGTAPGCNNAPCAERVCGQEENGGKDPFCCNVQWDATCALLATLVCPECVTDSDVFARTDCSCCAHAGCTVPSAANYDDEAAFDCSGAVSAVTDTSCCSFPSAGCADIAANNYDADRDGDCDGCCTYDPVVPASAVGCDDPAAFNYAPDASAACDDCCEYKFTVFAVHDGWCSSDGHAKTRTSILRVSREQHAYIRFRLPAAPACTAGANATASVVRAKLKLTLKGWKNTIRQGSRQAIFQDFAGTDVWRESNLAYHSVSQSQYAGPKIGGIDAPKRENQYAFDVSAHVQASYDRGDCHFQVRIARGKSQSAADADQRGGMMWWYSSDNGEQIAARNPKLLVTLDGSFLPTYTGEL